MLIDIQRGFVLTVKHYLEVTRYVHTVVINDCRIGMSLMVTLSA